MDRKRFGILHAPSGPAADVLDRVRQLTSRVTERHAEKRHPRRALDFSSDASGEFKELAQELGLEDSADVSTPEDSTVSHVSALDARVQRIEADVTRLAGQTTASALVAPSVSVARSAAAPGSYRAGTERSRSNVGSGGGWQPPGVTVPSVGLSAVAAVAPVTSSATAAKPTATTIDVPVPRLRLNVSDDSNALSLSHSGALVAYAADMSSTGASDIDSAEISRALASDISTDDLSPARPLPSSLRTASLGHSTAGRATGLAAGGAGSGAAAETAFVAGPAAPDSRLPRGADTRSAGSVISSLSSRSTSSASASSKPAPATAGRTVSSYGGLTYGGAGAWAKAPAAAVVADEVEDALSIASSLETSVSAPSPQRAMQPAYTAPPAKPSGYGYATEVMGLDALSVAESVSEAGELSESGDVSYEQYMRELSRQQQQPQKPQQQPPPQQRAKPTETVVAGASLSRGPPLFGSVQQPQRQQQSQQAAGAAAAAVATLQPRGVQDMSALSEAESLETVSSSMSRSPRSLLSAERKKPGQAEPVRPQQPAQSKQQQPQPQFPVTNDGMRVMGLDALSVADSYDESSGSSVHEPVSYHADTSDTSLSAPRPTAVTQQSVAPAPATAAVALTAKTTTAAAHPALTLPLRSVAAAAATASPQHSQRYLHSDSLASIPEELSARASPVAESVRPGQQRQQQADSSEAEYYSSEFEPDLSEVGSVHQFSFAATGQHQKPPQHTQAHTQPQHVSSQVATAYGRHAATTGAKRVDSSDALSVPDEDIPEDSDATVPSDVWSSFARPVGTPNMSPVPAAMRASVPWTPLDRASPVPPRPVRPSAATHMTEAAVQADTGPALAQVEDIVRAIERTHRQTLVEPLLLPAFDAALPGVFMEPEATADGAMERALRAQIDALKRVAALRKQASRIKPLPPARVDFLQTMERISRDRPPALSFAEALALVDKMDAEMRGEYTAA